MLGTFLAWLRAQAHNALFWLGAALLVGGVYDGFGRAPAAMLAGVVLCVCAVAQAAKE